MDYETDGKTDNVRIDSVEHAATGDRLLDKMNPFGGD